jgi:hypothetical protein
VDEALAVLSADTLREVLRELSTWVDRRMRARVESTLVLRAAHTRADWAPASLTAEALRKILAAIEAARDRGDARPEEVDAYLQRASEAFCARDYTAALAVYRALLPALADVEIDLGQDEGIDDVLGVDVQTCAAQYLVATYMQAPARRRAPVLCDALALAHRLAYIASPLREMERAAVEPLPELEAVLPRFRTLLEKQTHDAGADDAPSHVSRWLREVVARMDGPAGLAALARATRGDEDLRAWCGALVEVRDWEAALAACEEAAELTTSTQYVRGELLDTAALAAKKLHLRDVDRRLERAWQATPTLRRLRRWLGATRGHKALLARATAALAACPPPADRQRALLLVLLGELDAAAALLERAPGSGWSHADHPGHLLFPVLRRLLGGSESLPDDDLDEPGEVVTHGRTALAAPRVMDLVARAELSPSAAVRAAIVRAMRAAAERRLATVVGERRRRHYGHAASLVAGYAEVDRTRDGRAFVRGIGEQYRREVALQGALAERGVPG